MLIFWGVKAYLEFVLEDVFLGGHFAVETEESLLIGAERLFDRYISIWKSEVKRKTYADIDFVGLVWVHFVDCCAHGRQMNWSVVVR